MPVAKPAAPLAALKRREAVTFASVPDGMVGKVLGDLATDSGGRLIFVARDGQRLAEVERTIRFFAPTVEILDFPAWDCLPYDRASPNSAVVATRMATLAAPAGRAEDAAGRAHHRQRHPPAGSRSRLRGAGIAVARRRLGQSDGRHRPLAGDQRLPAERHRPRARRVCGPRRHPRPLRRPGEDEPVRLDFFGDTLETIRGFDPETQRTHDGAEAHRPRARERDAADARTRSPASASATSSLFGAADRDDLLYQSASEGRRYVGMEHWLPLFSDGLETLFDHVGDAPVVLDHLADEAVGRAARPDRRPLRGARRRRWTGRAWAARCPTSRSAPRTST